MENPVIKKESQQISLLHLCREEVRKAVVDKCKQTMICLLPAADYSTMLLFKYKLTWFFFFVCLLIYCLDFSIFEFNLFVWRAYMWRSEDSLPQAPLLPSWDWRWASWEAPFPAECCSLFYSFAWSEYHMARISHSDWIWALSKIKHISTFIPPYC